jgi:hypothetical protein
MPGLSADFTECVLESQAMGLSVLSILALAINIAAAPDLNFPKKGPERQ